MSPMTMSHDGALCGFSCLLVKFVLFTRSGSPTNVSSVLRGYSCLLVEFDVQLFQDADDGV